MSELEAALGIPLPSLFYRWGNRGPYRSGTCLRSHKEGTVADFSQVAFPADSRCFLGCFLEHRQLLGGI